MAANAAHTFALQRAFGGVSCAYSESYECRFVRHPRVPLRSIRGVSRQLHSRCVCRHHTHRRNTPRTLSRDDHIRSNGGIRRDCWHDCLWSRQAGRRPHSRNGDTSQCAGHRCCRPIVDTRGSAFPRTRLQTDQPRYNHATQAGNPVLREVWFLSVGEGPELLWYASIRVRQNRLIRPLARKRADSCSHLHISLLAFG